MTNWRDRDPLSGWAVAYKTADGTTRYLTTLPGPSLLILHSRKAARLHAAPLKKKGRTGVRCVKVKVIPEVPKKRIAWTWYPPC